MWDEMVPKFVKVYPNDYRRVIETQKRFKARAVGRGGDHGGVRGERARPGAGGREVVIAAPERSEPLIRDASMTAR